MTALYIHWPFCKSKCPYCDFNSHVRDAVDMRRWQKALLAELDYMARQTPSRHIASIFFGGGTPSLMRPSLAGALIDASAKHWTLSPDVEITLEANPTSVEAHTFPEFKAAGINRLSLGVQSLDDEQLRFLGRGHSAGEAKAAIARAREHFARTSFDLIYARPGQTPGQWQNELSEALALAGGHLSLYQLTIEENTAFYHAYKNGGFTLPDEETAEALYRLTEEVLAARGLFAYEVSNYARPGEESRHNLAYWQGDDYIGIGPGAHGRISVEPEKRKMEEAENKETSTCSSIPPFSSSLIRTATATFKSPERWLEGVEKNGHGLELRQEIDSVTGMEERLMMGLRLTSGIDRAPFAPILNETKRRLFVEKGLLADHPVLLKPTLAGRLVLNRLTAELLART